MGPLLVIAPAWIGDMVMAQALFRRLKQQAPDRHLAVAAPAATLELTRFMPEVDEAIALPFGHGAFAPLQRWRLGRGLRAQRFAQAIVLPRAFKAALMPWAAAIPRRTGYLGEARWRLLNDIRPLDKRLLPRTVDRFLALAEEQGQAPAPLLPPRLQVDASLVSQVLNSVGLQRPKGRLLALAPGAEYGPAKRWPVQHFASVARAAAADGDEIWIFGGPKDQALGAEIAQAAPKACLNLAGRTSLSQAVALLGIVDGLVTNDSGLMHIAAALDRRVVALYGPSDPGHTPPLAKRARLLRVDLPCSPCFARRCPLSHHRCMLELRPQAVLKALAALT